MSDRDTSGDPVFRIARTRLLVPTPHPEAIDRPRPAGRLRAGVLASRLTLVSAPAGSGKSTLLAGLPSLIPNAMLAWYTLDDEDNDPACFLAGLIESIRLAEPEFGATVSAVLRGASWPGGEMRRIIAVLVNDLFNLPGQLVIVLDDFHAVTAPGVIDGIDSLLERMPASVHVVISTRHDPPLSIGRLRARRELTELRLDDLVMTPEEIRDMLGATLETAEAVHAHTGGWPAAVALVQQALGAGAIEDPQELLERLHAGDRHVADYFAAEVVGRQGEHLRSFMLTTSILEDLTPAACCAVTGMDDVSGLLEELQRNNLFLVAIGPALQYQEVFRTFLFQQLMRAKTAAEVRDLYHRAALAEPSPHRAMQYLVAAEAWQDAARLIEVHGDTYLKRGAVETLRGWIDSLPESALDEYPRVRYMRGRCAHMMLELGRVETVLSAAIDSFRKAGDDRWLGSSLVYLSTALSTMRDFEAAAAASEEAATYALVPEDRLQLLLGLVWQRVAEGGASGALDALDSALDLAGRQRQRDALLQMASQLHVPLGVLPGASPGWSTSARSSRRS